MVTVLFYEKPGCINNTRQKALLTAAGHAVQAQNLLTEPWTVERLRLFFDALPVADWFNRSAPSVKAGDVLPEMVDAETALLMMVQNPLLIRRPLIQVGDLRLVGFDMAMALLHESRKRQRLPLGELEIKLQPCSCRV